VTRPKPPLVLILVPVVGLVAAAGLAGWLLVGPAPWLARLATLRYYGSPDVSAVDSSKREELSESGEERYTHWHTAYGGRISWQFETYGEKVIAPDRDDLWSITLSHPVALRLSQFGDVEHLADQRFNDPVLGAGSSSWYRLTSGPLAASTKRGVLLVTVRMDQSGEDSYVVFGPAWVCGEHRVTNAVKPPPSVCSAVAEHP
jgi:hypothetical protein